MKLWISKAIAQISNFIKFITPWVIWGIRNYKNAKLEIKAIYKAEKDKKLLK